jgi:lipoprotein NlpD
MPKMDIKPYTLGWLARCTCVAGMTALLAACGSRPPAPVVDRSTVSTRASEAARTPAPAAAARPATSAVPEPVSAPRPQAAIPQAMPTRPASGNAARPTGNAAPLADAPLIQVETVRSDVAPAAPASVAGASASGRAQRTASGAGTTAAPAPSPAPAVPMQPAPAQPAVATDAPPPVAAQSPAPPARPVQPAPGDASGSVVQAPADATGTGGRDASSRAAPGGGADRFSWPVPGRVLEGFSEPQNTALYLDGRMGDPVLAAAEGRVIFSGQGPKGYGNLLIVKHDEQLLSVYGHNRALLVKEGEQVRRGQQIAELGNSDSDRPRLRFEIRRDGRPVDPVRFLPPR